MASTSFVIVSSGAEYGPIPGVLTATQIQSMFAESVPGINTMNGESVTDSEGNVTVTFRLRTGTKG